MLCSGHGLLLQWCSRAPHLPLLASPAGNGAFIYSCHTHCASQSSAYNKFTVCPRDGVPLGPRTEPAAVSQRSGALLFRPVPAAGERHDHSAGRVQVLELGREHARGGKVAVRPLGRPCGRRAHAAAPLGAPSSCRCVLRRSTLVLHPHAEQHLPAVLLQPGQDAVRLQPHVRLSARRPARAAAPTAAAQRVSANRRVCAARARRPWLLCCVAVLLCGVVARRCPRGSEQDYTRLGLPCGR